MSKVDDLLLGPDEPIAWPTTALRNRDPEGRASSSRSRQVMTPRGKREEDRPLAAGVPQDNTRVRCGPEARAGEAPSFRTGRHR